MSIILIVLRDPSLKVIKALIRSLKHAVRVRSFKCARVLVIMLMGDLVLCLCAIKVWVPIRT